MLLSHTLSHLTRSQPWEASLITPIGQMEKAKFQKADSAKPRKVKGDVVSLGGTCWQACLFSS